MIQLRSIFTQLHLIALIHDIKWFMYFLSFFFFSHFCELHYFGGCFQLNLLKLCVYFSLFLCSEAVTKVKFKLLSTIQGSFAGGNAGCQINVVYCTGSTVKALISILLMIWLSHSSSWGCTGRHWKPFYFQCAALALSSSGWHRAENHPEPVELRAARDLLLPQPRLSCVSLIF